MTIHKRLNSLLFRGTGLILGFAVANLNYFPVLAVETTLSQKAQPSPTGDRIAQATSTTSPLADGVYLYGQSSQPEQIGQEYLVIRVKQGQVVGALYMPQSEFNCFYGSVNAKQMSLSVVDPYDNTVYPHTIALQTNATIAAQNVNSVSLTLEGYHEISQLSANDRRILDVCLQQQI